jgi:hypothetical protein
VQASIPSANGVIHGCYAKPGTPSRGTLRVIDGDIGEQCKVTENPISWNQGGPTGPTGLTGPTGPAGGQNVFTAAVGQFGALKGGSASAAKQAGTSSYEVTFGTNDVSNCVANASPGAFHGGSFTNDAIGTTIVPGAGGNSTVDVFFNENGGVSSNTDFMLMVAC